MIARSSWESLREAIGKITVRTYVGKCNDARRY
jgi:hypothetical protein